MAEPRFDRPALRIFTVAVGVAPEAGGTTIRGSGLQWVSMDVPGQFAPLMMVLRIGLPGADQANRYHAVALRVVDANQQSLGEDPFWLWQGNVPITPGLPTTEETDLPFAISLHPLRIERLGTIYFHVLLDGEVLGIMPFGIRSLTEEQRRRATQMRQSTGA